jgi:pyrophosphate--fructose-6-phosphate 1-phosphotransferase
MDSLSTWRTSYCPPTPAILKDIAKVTFRNIPSEISSPKDVTTLQSLFPKTFGKPLLQAQVTLEKKIQGPLNIGVIFSGGQAPGGHNVIAGVYDTIKSIDARSILVGFLDGPDGVIKGKFKEIKQEEVDGFRNEGGFHLIGSGRTKIDTEEQLTATLKNVTKLKLDGLIIVGGDDSNTNAAILAEFFEKEGCNTCVIGVPKTIDGDLSNAYVDISFGFDTACKVYSEMIGNIGRDVLSAKKYYHFVKLMGRSASHIALECALKTHPNLTLISEEIQKGAFSLTQIRDQICSLISRRAEKGKNYGIILIPEGLIEFIPEIKNLIAELNQILAKEEFTKEKLVTTLSNVASQTFNHLPVSIQDQLLLDRDPHGNVQVSKIETEKLLLELVERQLQILKERGEYGGKFSAVSHFFGYEGRSAYPSNFDAKYCYSLGIVSALLIREKVSGYMAAISGLNNETKQWLVYGVPLTSLMHIEIRHGKSKPVIKKALVDLQGRAFSYFKNKRDTWALEDAYISPGPMQFWGPAEITESIPHILKIRILD